MSGFVATAPTAPAQGEQDTIGNDGWFPDLSLAAVRDLVRIDGTVTDARLREAARNAMADINRRLAAFKAQHQAAGIERLADLPGAGTIDGESRYALIYRRAVCCLIKAELIERYRDFDATDSGQRRVADLEPAIDELRRSATWAVRDMLGQPHVIAELI